MKLGGDAEEFADEGSSGTHDVSNGKPLDSSARLNGWAISSLPFRRPPSSKTHLFNNIEGSFSKVIFRSYAAGWPYRGSWSGLRGLSSVKHEIEH